MYRLTSWRLPLAVLLMATVILLAGGLAVASNMGFKLNKPIAPGGTGQQGNNWTSLPFNNPYVNFGGLCTQLNLPATTILERLRPSDGAFVTQACPLSPGETLVAGEGIRIRVPTGGPTSVIIVGSHNPTLPIVIPVAGAGQKGNYWFSVPYHTTAVTMNDLCVQAGMDANGVAERLDAAAGGFTTKSCPSTDAAGVNLVLGEAVRLRDAPNGKTFIPAHF